MPAHTRLIGEDEAGQRLDRYLRRLLVEVPLAAIMKGLRTGKIRVDGQKAEPSLRLQSGMCVQLRLADSDLRSVTATPSQPSRSQSFIRIAVVYADEHVLVVDKPAGLAVQGGSGQQESLVRWLRASAFGTCTETFRPAPAHRLDADTSGLVAIGLSARGLRGLTSSFRQGEVVKVYYAVVAGRPAKDSGSVDVPLRTVGASSGRQPKVMVDAGGKPARTDYEVIGIGDGDALLRLRLHTGRMHQIRAHMSHLGHPVLGDRRYGGAHGAAGRLMLHAAELSFPHPTSGVAIDCASPLPPGFSR